MIKKKITTILLLLILCCTLTTMGMGLHENNKSNHTIVIPVYNAYETTLFW